MPTRYTQAYSDCPVARNVAELECLPYGSPSVIVPPCHKRLQVCSVYIYIYVYLFIYLSCLVSTCMRWQPGSEYIFFGLHTACDLGMPTRYTQAYSDCPVARHIAELECLPYESPSVIVPPLQKRLYVCSVYIYIYIYVYLFIYLSYLVSTCMK